MKKSIVIYFLFVSVFAFSQKKANMIKPVFRVIAAGGVVVGQKNVSSVFQVVPGVSIKRFYAGTGIGLDDYRFRSIPLFADVRYHFGRREFGFIYADAGYNFPFDVSKTQEAFKTTDIYKGGFYSDFGLGLRFTSFGKHSFLFSGGYSIKNIKNRVGHTFNWRLPGETPETFENFSFSMQRINAKLSWQFSAIRK